MFSVLTNEIKLGKYIQTIIGELARDKASERD